MKTGAVGIPFHWLHSPWLSLRWGLSLALLSLGTAGHVWGHDPGLSTATVRLYPGKLDAVVTFARKDAEQLLGQGELPIGAGGPAGLADQLAQLRAVVLEEFCVVLDGHKAAVTKANCQADRNGNTSVVLTFASVQFSTLAVQSKLLGRLAPGHREYVAVQPGNGKPLVERLLSAGADSVTIPNCFQIATATDTARATSFPAFLRLGVKHILTGYDHLLFLFGLLIVTRRLTSALQVITCFTLAHSLTLALATISPLPAPGRVVEPLIAASIVYVGIENLLRGGEPKGRWLLTFAFGLIHGCGFASALRELGVGTNGGGVAVPLFSFNFGVELGQLMIAALVLPVLWKLRSRPAFVRRWVPIGSVVVALLGGYWLVERVCAL